MHKKCHIIKSITVATGTQCHLCFWPRNIQFEFSVSNILTAKSVLNRCSLVLFRYFRFEWICKQIQLFPSTLNTFNMVVVNTETYMKIRKYFLNFQGLGMHLEHEVIEKFPEIDAIVISAILSKLWQKHIRNQHQHIVRNADNLLKE